jgi:hypothetical protein
MPVLPYTDLVDEHWADVAIQSIRVDAPVGGARPVYLDLTGSCPRCSDDMSATEWLVTIAGVSPLSREQMLTAVDTLRESGINVAETLPAEFTVKCSCHIDHPDPKGRPGLVGCGATWRMRVENA